MSVAVLFAAVRFSLPVVGTNTATSLLEFATPVTLLKPTAQAAWLLAAPMVLM